MPAEADAEEESELYLDLPEQRPENLAADAPSGIWLFIRMALVLLFVIACIYGVVFLLKRGASPLAGPDPYLRKTASLSLSPGKAVHVITVGNEAYLIGVSDNAVSLIGKIEDEELISAMNLNADRNTERPKSRDFASLLEAFMPGKKKNVSVRDISDVPESTERFLKNQRSRLRDVYGTDDMPDKGESS